jgi:chaperonin GroES
MMNMIYNSDDLKRADIKPAIERHKTLIESDNISESMDESELFKVGARVVEEYLIDKESQTEWLDRNDDYIDLAKQIRKEKTSPWEGAANIRLPLLADAAIKFQARAYAEIIQDNKVVKAKITGDDIKDEEGDSKAQRGERVSDYMSYQLTEEIEEWEPDTDKLLLMLAVVGHVYRKTYYDHSYGRIKSYLLTPRSLIVNNSTSCLKTARRVTECFDLTASDIKSLQNAGIYREVDIQTDSKEGESEQDKFYKVLEQHRWLDLDNDGIEEPYIVTVHEASSRVLAIKSRYDERSFKLNKKGDKVIRIEPKLYYQDYNFMPSFDGSYLGTGLGSLLYPLNEASNTIFNQLLDAGTLSNLQCGFVSKSIKIKGGITRFSPGEWKKTDNAAQDLRNGILPLPVREPSATLFNLLGLIMDLTKDVASIKDVLSGESPGANIPATTVAMLVEQGLKTYSAIYKRIHRSLKQEFKLLYELNYQYLDDQEYFKVLDNTRVAYREDFNYQDCDVVPISDPALNSDAQRLAQAQALLGALEFPGVNPRPIVQQYLEAVKAKNIEEILPEEDPNSIPPEVQQMQMEMELKQAELQIKQTELQLKQAEMSLKHGDIQSKNGLEQAKIDILREELGIKNREVDLKAQELEFKGDKYLADAMKSIADAEATESGQQLDAYKAVLDSTHREKERDERRELSRMGQPSSDGGSKKPTNPGN